MSEYRRTRALKICKRAKIFCLISSLIWSRNVRGSRIVNFTFAIEIDSNYYYYYCKCLSFCTNCLISHAFSFYSTRGKGIYLLKHSVMFAYFSLAIFLKFPGGSSSILRVRIWTEYMLYMGTNAFYISCCSGQHFTTQCFGEQSLSPWTNIAQRTATLLLKTVNYLSEYSHLQWYCWWNLGTAPFVSSLLESMTNSTLPAFSFYTTKTTLACAVFPVNNASRHHSQTWRNFFRYTYVNGLSLQRNKYLTISVQFKQYSNYWTANSSSRTQEIEIKLTSKNLFYLHWNSFMCVGGVANVR